MDTGDMISKVEVPIRRDDTSGTMFAKLGAAGAELLLATLPKLLAGELQATPQAHEEATYAPNLKRADESIDWSQPSERIYNQVRSLLPEPGAFTMWGGNVLKIRGCADPSADPSAAPSANTSCAGRAQDAREESAAPGTVLGLSEYGIEVATGDGSIRVTIVQPAGKSAMDAGAFVRGGQMKTGDILGRHR
jgi:methionyl-tRNA formyltransferase